MSQILLKEFEHGSKTKGHRAINGHRARGKACEARSGVRKPKPIRANARAVDRDDSRKRAVANERRTGNERAWRFPSRDWFSGEVRDRLLVVAIFAVPAIECGAAFMRGLIG